MRKLALRLFLAYQVVSIPLALLIVASRPMDVFLGLVGVALPFAFAVRTFKAVRRLIRSN